MKTILLILASLLPFAALAQNELDLEPYRAASLERWEGAVANLEALDATESHPDDAILFVGSSSIRRWDTIVEDMAPYHPIQRGIDSFRWSDAAIFADRLITPHQFRAVVFFVANDITGRDDDATPEKVVAFFAHVWQRVRAHNPDAPVFYIAVTPTPSRWVAWPENREANSAIRSFCAAKPNTWFIGTESVFLDADGQPRPELFVSDQLHLNRDGYTLWAAAIKSHLDTVLDAGAFPSDQVGGANPTSSEPPPNP